MRASERVVHNFTEMAMQRGDMCKTAIINWMAVIANRAHIAFIIRFDDGVGGVCFLNTHNISSALWFN